MQRVVATYHGGWGRPVLLDLEVWTLLSTNDDQGARGLVAGRFGLVAEAAREGSTTDIDTREDLRRWS